MTKTLASSGASICVPCSAGSYSSDSTQACTTCAEDLVSAPGASACYSSVLKFEFTNSVQQWVVPDNVDFVAVDAYGAAGGEFNSAYKGGLGGYISVGNIAASSFVGHTLFIYVGQSGAFDGAISIGGGGGRPDPHTHFYTSGGGATDLRTSLSELASR